MADEVFDPPMLLAPMTQKIVWEPLGVVLVFGSWNYPYVVTIKPLIQAIAAGNCCVLKPSELSPVSSDAIEKLVTKYLDPRCYRVILGDARVAQQLNKMKFDMICFTGSTQTGRLVAKAAADNLTPCVLELGGKCPLIVDSMSDIDFAASKCVNWKFQNAGQTCVTVDYVLVHESQKNLFVERCMHHLKQQFGIDVKDKSTWKGPND